jgi:hypothetical protein
MVGHIDPAGMIACCEVVCKGEDNKRVENSLV